MFPLKLYFFSNTFLCTLLPYSIYVVLTISNLFCPLHCKINLMSDHTLTVCNTRADLISIHVHLWMFTSLLRCLTMQIKYVCDGLIRRMCLYGDTRHCTVHVLHSVVSHTRVYETSAGGLRSIHPSLGMRQLFSDVTMSHWRHNQPT